MNKISIIDGPGASGRQAPKGDLRRAPRLAGLALLGLALPAAALAQGQDSAAANGLGGETVSWSVAPQSADAVKPGSRLTLTLSGAVRDGWHVYALKQLPGGPTPLRIVLDTADVATADGAPASSPPTTIHDPAFDLDTEFYAHAFTVTAPVRLGPRLAAGRQTIPVSVRFQTCNGVICQPPKTVHLSVPINVRADG